MRWKVILLAVVLALQFFLFRTVNGGSAYSIKYAIDYDSDFEDVPSYWVDSTWHPHGPADNWIEAQGGTITLYYKADRTDWGNTEVYQGKKPAYPIEKSLRFRDFVYKEGSGGLNLSAKVKRDIDPVWQGSSLNLSHSLFPQANVGVYLWLEVPGWDYDVWNTTSSIVVDVYFDSRHQDPSTNETVTSNVGCNWIGTTPYDPQVHAGYVQGTLSLDSWQVFNVDVAALIDQTLQKCRDELHLALPSSEVVIKFFGVYVDSFSAAVQASFDYVLLTDTSTEELQAEVERISSGLNSTMEQVANLTGELNSTRAELEKIENKLNATEDQVAIIAQEFDSVRAELETVRTLMYIFTAAIIVSIATTIYFASRKPKKVTVTS